MADIELVIKIPEDAYNYIKANGARIPYYKLINAIKNGTPLPRGHGRLIDADALEPDYYGDWNGLCITEDKYTQRTIDDAPTIIEADKAESEG